MADEKKSSPWVTWVTIICSIIGAIGVIITAYFGYLEKKPEPIPPPALIKPTVECKIGRFTGAHLRIGNAEKEGIIMVSNLTLHWDFRECQKVGRLPLGAPMIEYKYIVDLTKSRGSKLLDKRTFKYPPEEVEDFRVGINFPPGRGVYQVWLEFDYSEFGKDNVDKYSTEPVPIDLCGGLPEK